MPSTIQIKRGTTDPTATQVTNIGELAANTSTPKLFIKTASDSSTAPVWVGASIEASPGDWTSATKLATQSAINTTFMPKGGGSFTGDITLNAQSDLRFADSDSSNWVAFQAPATVTSNVTWTLPSSDGSAGTVLSTNGSGTLSWASAGSATTVTTNDDNTNTTRYLVFSTSAQSGATLYVDGSTTPLTYNPNTNFIGTSSTGGVQTNNIQSTANDTVFTINSTGSDTGATFSLQGAAVTASIATTTATTINLNGAIVTNGSSFELPATYTIGDSSTSGNTLNISNAATTSLSTKTVNIGTGGASNSTTNINIGSATSGALGTITLNHSAVIEGDLSIRGGDLTTTTSTTNVFDTTATTINAFGAATTGNIGYDGTAASTTNISTGAVAASTTKTLNLGTGGAASSTTNVNIGSSNGGTVTINSDAVISGNLTVNGTTTTVNSTTLTIDDKNIVLGNDNTLDTAADGGGITLNGATPKTFNWVDSTDAWTSSEHMNLLTGKAYYINGVSVLSSNTLGTGVTSSSLTSVGTITTGVWNGTDIALADGGTNASLTAVNGGVVYSTSSAMAITSAGNSGEVLRSNGAAAPTWTAQSNLTAGVATTVTLVGTNTTNATHYLTFVDSATGDENIRTDTALSYNPSTNILTAGTVEAIIDGGSY